MEDDISMYQFSCDLTRSHSSRTNSDLLPFVERSSRRWGVSFPPVTLLLVEAYYASLNDSYGGSSASEGLGASIAVCEVLSAPRASGKAIERMVEG